MNHKPVALTGRQWAVLAAGDEPGLEQVVCWVTLHDVECWGCTCGAWQWCPHIQVLWAFLGLEDPLAALHAPQEGPVPDAEPPAA